MIALNFHGVGEPHPTVPADERPYWLSLAGFRQVIERVMRTDNPAKFLFTFDDGNKSDLLAAEILAEHGLSGRFFLLTGRFDQQEYCSRDDARRLHAQGMIVGLHGRDHRDWKRLDDTGLADETVAARAELTDAIGAPVDEVAIPFGSYDRRVMRWLKEQSFARIHTSDGGTLDPSAIIWNRNTLRCDMSEAELDRILRGSWPVSRNFRRSVASYIKRNIA